MLHKTGRILTLTLVTLIFAGCQSRGFNSEEPESSETEVASAKGGNTVPVKPIFPSNAAATAACQAEWTKSKTCAKPGTIKFDPKLKDSSTDGPSACRSDANISGKCWCALFVKEKQDACLINFKYVEVCKDFKPVPCNTKPQG